MPNFFDEPAALPDPTTFLSAVRTEARKRIIRRRSRLAAVGALAMAGVGAGIVLAVPGHADPVDRVQASSGGPAGQRAVTRTIDYQPYTANGALAAGITVTASFTGHCTRASFPLRPDTYRCAVGSTVYVLCFRSPVTTGAVVACPELDDPTHVVVVTPMNSLTRGDTPTPSSAEQAPWDVELADGHYCWFAPAAGAGGGASVTFDCAHGVLYGTPTPAGTNESVVYQAGHGGPEDSSPRTSVTVRALWM